MADELGQQAVNKDATLPYRLRRSADYCEQGMNICGYDLANELRAAAEKIERTRLAEHEIGVLMRLCNQHKNVMRATSQIDAETYVTARSVVETLEGILARCALGSQ